MDRSKLSPIRDEGRGAGGGAFAGTLDEGRVLMGDELASVSHSASTADADITRPVAAPAAGGARLVGGEDARGSHDGPGPQVLSASSIDSEDVVNAQGEDLGEIKELMIDIQSGRVAYAVLGFGGFLGMGEKLFAIPWSAFKLDADNRCFILDVAQERLKEAPGFDKDDWPSMADPQWAATIHSYYGASPYWE